MALMDSPALKISAVGDIMLGDNALHIQRGVRTRWRGNALSDILNHLREPLATDLCVGNLECVLADLNSRNPMRMIFVGDPSRASELAELGFTHLCLANNHILDHGQSFALGTMAHVEKAGVRACGLKNPTRVTHRGNVIDVFNFSLVPIRHENAFYCDRLGDQELLALEQSDAHYKIVSIHWGDEYSRYPSPAQIGLGHELIDRGARLVVGHHPHVLQGVEQYRDGIIAYSLGNFIFDHNWSRETSTGCILQVYLKDDGSQRFETVLTRQDDSFVPQRWAEGQMLDLNRNVLRYSSDPEGYAKYSRRRLLEARIAMKLEILKDLRHVNPNTWLVMLMKRFPKLGPSLYKSGL